MSHPYQLQVEKGGDTQFYPLMCGKTKLNWSIIAYLGRLAAFTLITSFLQPVFH